MRKAIVLAFACLLVVSAGTALGAEQIFADDFEGYQAGPLGEPWSVSVDEGNSAQVSTEAASPYEGGIQGLRLVDTKRQGQSVSVWLSFELIDNGTVVLEFDFRVDNPESAFRAVLMACPSRPWGGSAWWSSTLMQLGSVAEAKHGEPGLIFLMSGDDRAAPVGDLQPAVWYHYRQAYPVGGDTVQVELTDYQGQRIARNDLPALNSHPYIERLGLGTVGMASLGILDLDNIRISHLPGEKIYRREVHGPVPPSLATAGQRFQQALALVDLATNSQATERGFWVAQAEALTEVFPDTFSTELAAEGIELSAARGEAESFQIVLTAVRDLEQVEVEVGEFEGPAGVTLSSDRVDTWLVHYEKSGRVFARAPDRKWWPEALLPFSGMSVPAQQTRSVWMTVHVPPRAVAGDYHATVTVQADQEQVSIPLHLQVYDFVLPRHSSLENDLWLSLADYNYGNYFDPEDLQQYESFCRFMEQYRLSCAPTGNNLCSRFVAITRTGPEQYEFDFSGCDSYLEIAFRHGTNAWNPNLSCNSGFTTYLAGYQGDVKGTDAATGEEVVLVEKRKSPWNDRRERHLQLIEDLRQPLATQFWQAYVAHLKEKGWLEACNFEVLDENAGTESYVAAHRTLHEIVPDLRLMSYQSTPLTHPRALGLNGLWAPLLEALDYSIEAMRERQQEYGEKAWFYICNQRTTSSSGHTASIFMPDPPMDRRILPWFCWEYGLDGFMIFALNSWKPWDREDRDPAEYDLPVLPYVFAPGRTDDGRLIYPWQDAGGSWRIIPSIRLECVRDGLEDYEYFHLLREQDPGHPLLQMPPEIITNVMQWTKDPAVINQYRQQLAQALEQAK